MATRIQVKRLANPRRAKRRNAAKRRRKMSIKQIRIFGTRAQKAGLKRRRNGSMWGPRKKSPAQVLRAKVRRKRRTKSNPALVVTLGAMNPRRKKRRNKPVAASRKNRRRRRRVNTAPARRTNRRRRRNPVARRTNRRRRRNATRVVVVAPRQNRRRRRNSARRVNRRRVHHRRRNPISSELFGAPLFGKDSLELISGGVVGLAAAKFIPTLLPGSLTGGIASSSIGKVVVSGISAVVGGWAGSKVSVKFGQGMLFGGMMQTLSIALNAFLPTVYGQMSQYASLGDLMNGGFTVPQNPLRLPPPPPMALPPAGAQARMNMNGLARAYGSAF